MPRRPTAEVIGGVEIKLPAMTNRERTWQEAIVVYSWTSGSLMVSGNNTILAIVLGRILRIARCFYQNGLKPTSKKRTVHQRIIPGAAVGGSGRILLPTPDVPRGVVRLYG